MFHAAMKRLAGSAVLAYALAHAVPASGQSTAYGGQVTVTTAGMPGAYSSSLTKLGVNSLSVNANPAGVAFRNGTAEVFADTEASAGFANGNFQVGTYAFAQRISGTYFYNNPYAAAAMKFSDTLSVTSKTLPAGTPVTLVFRNGIGPYVQGSSGYSGYGYATLSVLGKNTRNRFDVMNGQIRVTESGPAITVQTAVGSRFALNVAMGSTAQAWYLSPGPIYNGMVGAGAQGRIAMTVQTGGVTVTAASGNVY